MPRHRFVMDLQTKEPLTDRQLMQISKQADDFVKAVATDEITEKDVQVTFHHGHLHVSTDESACHTCRALSRDGRN